MNETTEVANTMLADWLAFIDLTGNASFGAAVRFVRTVMPDESVTVIDNVAFSLFKQAENNDHS